MWSTNVQAFSLECYQHRIDTSKCYSRYRHIYKRYNSYLSHKCQVVERSTKCFYDSDLRRLYGFTLSNLCNTVSTYHEQTRNVASHIHNVRSECFSLTWYDFSHVSNLSFSTGRDDRCYTIAHTSVLSYDQQVKRWFAERYNYKYFVTFYNERWFLSGDSLQFSTSLCSLTDCESVATVSHNWDLYGWFCECWDKDKYRQARSSTSYSRLQT